jgi:hypothetical protein
MQGNAFGGFRHIIGLFTNGGAVYIPHDNAGARTYIGLFYSNSQPKRLPAVLFWHKGQLIGTPIPQN